MYKNSGVVIVWNGLLAADWQEGMILFRIPGKLQPSALQFISHVCHCCVPKERVLSAMGRKYFFLLKFFSPFHITYVLRGIGLSLEK